jgi:hypothetical protein
MKKICKNGYKEEMSLLQKFVLMRTLQRNYKNPFGCRSEPKIPGGNAA